MTTYSRILQVSVHVPEDFQTAQQIEEILRARNPAGSLLPGTLQQMYGLRQRRTVPDTVWPSDLAALAGRQALHAAGLPSSAVDLLIYAAVSEDMEEPATAHIVAHKLAVTAPVFDIKNACNGVLDAMHVADALIRTGQHRRVLIVTGETGSRLSRWTLPERAEWIHALSSLTAGDMGAAVLLGAGTAPGIVGAKFFANSGGWPAATMVNPYFGDDRERVLRIDSDALVASFAGMDRAGRDTLDGLRVTMEELDLVCVHQASTAFTRLFCQTLGVDPAKVIPTFAQHGNVGTATLPLQLARAVEQRRLAPGDLVGLFGLASGASAGAMVVRW
ncbi:ketoacyl-ACP synthase III [Streptomyces ziwulingensis]|uniref:Ketoacyl-ACP synthase III n=1 Tax=Streptomyces ziwulingensis TaxID=1045501 RepID=A0ABP9CUU4_9ACTN